MSPKRSIRKRTALNRRTYALLTGAATTGAIAGCLGDDDDDPADVDDVDDTDAVDGTDDVDDTDDADDTDDVDPADDPDDADDADDADDDPDIERHDVVVTNTLSPPVPADAQYGIGWSAEPTPAFMGGNRYQYTLMGRSLVDHEVNSFLLEDWDYRPGFLEITFQDDVFWWSGKPVDAHDWYGHMELTDWVAGGDDLDAYPNIISRQLIDDRTMQLALADTWRQDWALQQSVVGEHINGSFDFHEPWIEEFADTGGDMDAVEDVRTDISELWVDDDDGLVHHLHIPFEFRLADDGYGEVGEDYWELELVPEKNGQQRAYVEDINYTRLRFTAEEETSARSMDRFFEGEEPYQNYEFVLDEDVPFDYQVIEFEGEGEIGAWGWNMNTEAHPTDNPHFRRAWSFATRRSDFEWETRPVNELNGHPFLSEARLRRWVSEDVVEEMTVYGIDAEWDRAEEEMEIGGFEQDADGRWLRQDDGEPIEIDLFHYSWMADVADYGSDWWEDMDDFGITIEPSSDITDPWTVDADFTGGLLPEWVFSTIFGEEDLSWTATNPGFPESVEAPEVGDTDAPQEDWVEYDTRTMADRLGVTLDEDPYQNMVDQLAWVANQLVPRTLVVTDMTMHAYNDERWRLKPPQDHPELFVRPPWERVWFNGTLSYVPEDER